MKEGRRYKVKYMEHMLVVSNNLWAPLETEPWTRKEHSIPMLCHDLLTPAAFDWHQGCKATTAGSLSLKKHASAISPRQKNAPLTPFVIPHCNMHMTYTKHQITTVTTNTGSWSVILQTWTCWEEKTANPVLWGFPHLRYEVIFLSEIILGTLYLICHVMHSWNFKICAENLSAWPPL